MKNRSSIFGSDPEQIDKLLAWPLDADPEEERLGLLDQFTEAPGDQIGRYKLLKVLGEGGMGIVYLAEQTEPVKREVALKVIKPGMDSKRVIARFEAEQQTLALMDHRYVAHVYDAGLAPSGRPYFVMEYIDGQSITEFCDQHRLTVEERLHLFLHVCEAVQYAHQKAIVHRDLKPSNVLVIVQNDKGVPKVIDFGVARAIHQPLTERPFYTEADLLVGTPEYMSPEQADPGNQDIDTRTDVYSLGVLLYELLTGMLPFARETFRTGGIDHIREVICEQDPATPSTRLSKTSASELTESAQKRRTDARTLKRKLHGDLDWITLKAMEKDRTRRYTGVDAMATDIRNHLNNQPVTAAPPSIRYRLRKFSRRHRQTIAACATVLMVLAIVAWAIRTSIQADRQQRYAQALEDERLLVEAQEAFDTRDFSLAQQTIVPLLNSPQVGLKAKLLSAQLHLVRQEPNAAIQELESLFDAPNDVSGQAHSLLATLYYHKAAASLAKATEPLQKWNYHREEAEKRIGGTAQDCFLKACATSIVRDKLDWLNKALAQNKSHYPSLRERAYIHLAQHEYESTCRDATLMMGMRPDDPQGYFLNATALRKLGRFDEALADLNTAIGLDPNDVRLYIGRWETYTLMGRHEDALPDIRKCVDLEPDDFLHPVRLCVTLTALGRYDEAKRLYGQYVDRPDLAKLGYGTSHIGKVSSTLFHCQLEKLTFDLLAAGISPYPPADPPVDAAHWSMYVMEELFKSLSQNGTRIVNQAFHPSWSPDGTKLVYSMGFALTNAVAMLDLQTGKTELLTIPGKDPEWSPDGKTIAFARSRTLLPPQRLTGLGVEVFYRGYGPVNTANDEVWIMDMESRSLRRIGDGGWPHWGRQSGRLYYTSRRGLNHTNPHTLYSIDVNQPNAQAQVVLHNCSLFPVVSPDERYVADHRFRELRVIELASGQIVRRWFIPPRPRYGLYVNWSPDGRELSVAGWDGSETGLWNYNMETEDAVKIAGVLATTARWSGGDHPRLAIAFGSPLTEIWMWDLQPGAPTAESFDFVQNVEEHCRWCIDQCSDIVAADPIVVDMRWVQVDCALWIDHERTNEFLADFEATLKPDEYSADSCWQFCSLVLSSAPEIQERLMPMLLLLARKAVEKEPDNPEYQKVLDEVLQLQR
jgi:serine/threonine protein kinase